MASAATLRARDSGLGLSCVDASMGRQGAWPDLCSNADLRGFKENVTIGRLVPASTDQPAYKRV